MAIWGVVFLLALVAAGAFFASATTTEQSFTNKPEAERASDSLEASGLRGEKEFVETVVIEHPTLEVDEPAYASKVSTIVAQLEALGPAKVSSVLSQASANGQQFVSDSRRSTVILVTMAGDVDQVSDSIVDVRDITDRERTDGFVIGVAGAASIGADFQEVSERDLRVGESIGIFAAIAILLLVFGTVGASWIPIVMAIFAIILAVAASALIGQVYKLSFFVINMITMIGLAVGIDYTLFIVARFREERAKGVAKVDAIARAGATASRAVFFSGLTVVFALLGMLIVPTNIFFSLGLGSILVVLAAILLALTFLPAVLSLVGDRVNAWRLPFLPKNPDSGAQEAGFWNWTSRTVLKRPVIFLVITGGGLIALTVPYFDFPGINKGFNGVNTLPDSFESKHAYETLITEFPQVLGTSISSVDVVVLGDVKSQATSDAMGRLSSSLSGNAAFGQPEPFQASADGRTGLLQVPLKVTADSDAANNGVRALRDDLIPAAAIPGEVLVGGDTAFNVDFFDLSDRWQPIVLLFVLALSFVLLTIVFHSIVVPIKAIILNLLSVGAAYGLLVLVFQEGWLVGILGFQQVDVIEAWIPLFLFSVLFGLSMDYEVFLLSRIRERYDETKNNEESVAFGLRSTGSIITGAALIMVAVFAGFALGDLVMFQQMGFGLGVAVLVDATIIRSVLVPSTMKLLGSANWYLPRFLAWLPDFRVEVAEPARHTPAGAPAGGANGHKK
jgi:RND superfamily putative drug exporter